jgi:serine/threonine protein kinase
MDRVLAEFDEVSEIPTATPGAAAWKAHDRQTGHPMLIKRLPPDPQTKTRATQALSLDHPNIVKTSRWLRDVPGVYVVRDYVPGRNLRSLLADAAQRAFDRLQERLNPILDAIDHAHHSGFAHGAVTPENVLIDENGRPILSDFATAQHIHRGLQLAHVQQASDNEESRKTRESGARKEEQGVKLRRKASGKDTN